jgi:hypothetical protein
MLASLESWHGVLLAYAILMGLEGPALLLVAHYKRRPWYEHLLAAAPSLAFFWIVTVARGVQNTYDYWQSYLRFEANYVPPEFASSTYWQMSGVVAHGTQLGWTTCALTAALLSLGCALALRWQTQHEEHDGAPLWGRLATTARERWPRWQSARERAAVVETSLIAGAPDDLEITIEPIDPRRR